MGCLKWILGEWYSSRSLGFVAGFHYLNYSGGEEVGEMRKSSLIYGLAASYTGLMLVATHLRLVDWWLSFFGLVVAVVLFVAYSIVWHAEEREVEKNEC